MQFRFGPQSVARQRTRRGDEPQRTELWQSGVKLSQVFPCSFPAEFWNLLLFPANTLGQGQGQGHFQVVVAAAKVEVLGHLFCFDVCRATPTHTHTHQHTHIDRWSWKITGIVVAVAAAVKICTLTKQFSVAVSRAEQSEMLQQHCECCKRQQQQQQQQPEQQAATTLIGQLCYRKISKQFVLSPVVAPRQQARLVGNCCLWLSSGSWCENCLWSEQIMQLFSLCATF